MVKFSSGALLMVSLEGQTLGQYKVIAQMGSGGMATVYEAYHARLDRTVAIKMLHEAFQEDKNFLARFEREAQIVARLDHPHIVPVYDFDEFNGRPYLVMKYIEGRTLKAELEDHPLTMDEILHLLPPIAAALDYAHRQGVLHRDIKPSNVIIDNNGIPYVTDFGLARMAQLGESTLSHDVLLGTPHYISPEQAMGNRDLDSRTDLYSFGIILYELVVGRVPFSADTPFAVIHDQIYRELPKPSSINPEIKPPIDAVLQKALAKAPTERYATATEMVDAFRKAVEQSGLKTLNPDRASFASESLAKVRDEQNRQTPSQTPSVSIPAPMPASSQQAQTNEAAEEDDPQWWVKGRLGISRPPQPPRRPNPPDASKAKRVVEASFDFSDARGALQSAGNIVREAFEGISASLDKNPLDVDFAPLDDEAAMRKRVEFQLNKRKEFSIHLAAYILVVVLMWIIYGTTIPQQLAGNDADLRSLLGFPWPLIVMLGWGSGLAAHAVETAYTTGRRANLRLRAIHSELYNLYGEDWRRADRKELRKVRDRVSQAINKKREWIQHLVVYLTINLMLWMIYLNSSSLPFVGDVSASFPWPLIVSLGWGIGLVSHGIEYMSHNSREHNITRAIEQERDRLYEDEKPKRDRRGGRHHRREAFDDSRIDRAASHVRLTEDGELTDSMVEQIDDEAKIKRRR